MRSSKLQQFLNQFVSSCDIEKWEVTALKKQSMGGGERGQSSRNIWCCIGMKYSVLRNCFLIILSYKSNIHQVVNYRSSQENAKTAIWSHDPPSTQLRATTVEPVWTPAIWSRKEMCCCHVDCSNPKQGTAGHSSVTTVKNTIHSWSSESSRDVLAWLFTRMHRLFRDARNTIPGAISCLCSKTPNGWDTAPHNDL